MEQNIQNNQPVQTPQIPDDGKTETERIKEKKILAALAYLALLIAVPYFTSREDQFVRFHIKQGLVVIGCWIVYWVASIILSAIPFTGLIQAIFFPVGALSILLLMTIGLMNVNNFREKELPIVGIFARKITL